jgi:hypothetical protein
VLSSGAGGTFATPVYNGSVLRHAISQNRLCGRDIDNYLSKQLVGGAFGLFVCLCVFLQLFHLLTHFSLSLLVLHAISFLTCVPLSAHGVHMCVCLCARE